MNDYRSTEDLLDEIEERELVWKRSGTVFVETLAVKEYTSIDMVLLSSLLRDFDMDWDEAKTAYLEIAGELG